MTMDQSKVKQGTSLHLVVVILQIHGRVSTELFFSFVRVSIRHYFRSLSGTFCCKQLLRPSRELTIQWWPLWQPSQPCRPMTHAQSPPRSMGWRNVPNLLLVDLVCRGDTHLHYCIGTARWRQEAVVVRDRVKCCRVICHLLPTWGFAALLLAGLLTPTRSQLGCCHAIFGKVVEVIRGLHARFLKCQLSQQHSFFF